MSTPLVVAAANGFVLAVETLIAAGAKINGKKFKNSKNIQKFKKYNKKRLKSATDVSL